MKKLFGILAVLMLLATQGLTLLAEPAMAQQNSNKVTFTVNNLAPTVASISPNTAVAGAAGLALTVTGTGYVAGTTAAWGTTVLNLSAQTSTSLTAAIPAALLASAGTFTVTVSNPSPGGGTATSTFAVTLPPTPVPTISSAVPASVIAGASNTTVTFTGTNYQSNAVAFLQSGTQPAVALTTTFVSATSVTAVIPSAQLASAGIFSLYVQNPGGVVAHTVNLTWTASTSKISGYNAYRSQVSGTGYVKLNAAPIGTLSFTDATAQSGQKYFYVTTALDAAGSESVFSNEAGAAIP